MKKRKRYLGLSVCKHHASKHFSWHGFHSKDVNSHKQRCCNSVRCCCPRKAQCGPQVNKTSRTRSSFWHRALSEQQCQIQICPSRVLRSACADTHRAHPGSSARSQRWGARARPSGSWGSWLGRCLAERARWRCRSPGWPCSLPALRGRPGNLQRAVGSPVWGAFPGSRCWRCSCSHPPSCSPNPGGTAGDRGQTAPLHRKTFAPPPEKIHTRQRKTPVCSWLGARFHPHPLHPGHTLQVDSDWRCSTGPWVRNEKVGGGCRGAGASGWEPTREDKAVSVGSSTAWQRSLQAQPTELQTGDQLAGHWGDKGQDMHVDSLQVRVKLLLSSKTHEMTLQESKNPGPYLRRTWGITKVTWGLLHNGNVHIHMYGFYLYALHVFYIKEHAKILHVYRLRERLDWATSIQDGNQLCLCSGSRCWSGSGCQSITGHTHTHTAGTISNIYP